MPIQSQNLIIKIILKHTNDLELSELSQLVALYDDLFKKRTEQVTVNSEEDKATALEQELQASVTQLNIYVQECIFKGTLVHVFATLSNLRKIKTKTHSNKACIVEFYGKRWRIYDDMN